MTKMLLFLEQATETITMVHCQLESTTAIREYLKNNNPSLFFSPPNPLPISTPARVRLKNGFKMVLTGFQGVLAEYQRPLKLGKV